MLGRRTKLSSADIGVKQWWYDASGNMIMESDSELEKQGKRINYEYDGMNRLVKIDYPRSEPTVYEYGEWREGVREDNAAGRVTRVTDESGSISYSYGRLGQVEKEERVIKLLPLSGGKTKEATTGYLSDYLGRMQEIYYPDGETVSYKYGYGGQIVSVTGERKGTPFPYVKMIGYDEYSQRIFIEYGSGVKTRYQYDPYRRWLKHIRTESAEMRNAYQDIEYSFDDVGNVEQYTNNAWGHTTSQSYGYDSLYQLTSVNGNSKSHPWSPTGSTEYTTTYKQTFEFSIIGNMTSKVSTESVSNTNRIGTDLNYSLDYAYYKGTHKAERIGTRYYDYDGNGNLVAEREGGHATNPNVYRPYYQDGNMYWAEYGFGLVRPEGNKQDDGVYQRNYRWNERNLLSETSDSSYTVHYRYGADGQRALKFTANSGRATVYFNKLWQTSNISADWLQGKHVYVGEDRIATKYNSEGNDNTQAEKERTYYYHSDHLGSAQTVTNWRGQVHERLEYTPYGELWIDWKSADAPEDKTPFRFTGKEPDPETGLYYYGARYLDPKTSRWISGDPALGDYLPSAPLGEEEKKRNGNLPGQGGVFNYVNLHVYHYAGNNPVVYRDPDGKSNRTIDKLKDIANSAKNFISENEEAIKVIGVGFLQVAAGKLLKGGGIGGGAALAVLSNGTLAPVGITLGTVAVVAGQTLEVSGELTIGIGLAMIADNNRGSDYRDKTRGANQNDRQQIDNVAKEAKIDRKEFGKFVDQTKKLEGRRPSDNYEYKELQELAKVFKELQ